MKFAKLVKLDEMSPSEYAHYIYKLAENWDEINNELKEEVAKYEEIKEEQCNG